MARQTPRLTKSNQLTADALSNSSTRNDLRTTLNARKSLRISAVDPDPKECPNGDLRDKINAGACDLRIRLNRSKPTDLRRRLEQTKMSSNDTPS
ncbi:hypothetical protein F2Q68_00005601 [Brassica cretica]|uniref:Uncharacterized protein n=1 Tax=Brassica cretica TaxID=69181 RepID=A0A8S9JI99_BRACR|nr:hypothetical protein F2Q68_00005601 [Brassica cretica]